MAKYFKIMRMNECHFGLQYKTGLNVDPIPFNPTGNCEPGGIYFADIENILYYRDFGPWIREVRLPKDALIYQEHNKWKANKVILGKRRKLWTVSTFKWLEKNGLNFNSNYNIILHSAISLGALPLVKFLLQTASKNEIDIFLVIAAASGQLSVVKFLLDRYNLKRQNSYALMAAAEKGYTKIVKLLLPLSDPKDFGSYALRSASTNKHMDIVKLLVPVSDIQIVKELGLEECLPKKGKK